MKKFLTLSFLCFAQVVHAYSECCSTDQYIEVASKEPTYESLSGKSIDVIDYFMIDQYKTNRLVQSIHTVPGVELKEIAGLSTVRIRGMRSYDTKYLYNGVPIKDPSHPQSSYLPFLDDTVAVGNHEIQILKGSGGVLYGSEAIGGVVDIVPIRNEFSILSEIGETIKETVTTPIVSASRSDSENYWNNSLRAEYKTDHISPFLLLIQSEGELNDAPFISDSTVHIDQNDENNRSEEMFVQSGVKIDFEPVHWTGSISDSERRFLFLPDADGSDFYSDGTFSGTVIYSDLRFSNFITVGHTFERQFYELESVGHEDEIDRYENDFYVEKGFDVNGINILLGARENIHEDAKHRTVYDISGVYKAPSGTTIRSHFGTGFMVPSLYELNGAFLTDFGRFEIGNPNLSPERSKSFDVGFEQEVTKDIRLGITYFESSVRNQIVLIGSSYKNVDGIYSPHGFEAWYEQFLIKSAILRLAYTRTTVENLIDVPGHSIDAVIRFHKGKWNGSLRASFRDTHRIQLFDMDTFSVLNINEDGYFKADLTVGYKVSTNVEIFGRADNLFSEDYTASGYRQPGTRLYAGAKVTF